MADTDPVVGSPTTNDADEHVVRLVGELDVANADRLREVLAAITQPSPRIVVELSELSFMDSSGLGVLLEQHRRGATVVLRNPSPIIRRVVEATGLTDVLRFDP
jgi:anti-sigma B factor antagonist